MISRKIDFFLLALMAVSVSLQAGNIKTIVIDQAAPDNIHKDELVSIAQSSNGEQFEYGPFAEKKYLVKKITPYTRYNGAKEKTDFLVVETKDLIPYILETGYTLKFAVAISPEMKRTLLKTSVKPYKRVTPLAWGIAASSALIAAGLLVSSYFPK